MRWTGAWPACPGYVVEAPVGALGAAFSGEHARRVLALSLEGEDARGEREVRRGRSPGERQRSRSPQSVKRRHALTLVDERWLGSGWSWECGSPCPALRRCSPRLDSARLLPATIRANGGSWGQGPGTGRRRAHGLGRVPVALVLRAAEGLQSSGERSAWASTQSS